MKDYLPGFDTDGVWMPRPGPVDWDEVFRHYSPAVRAYVRMRVPPAAVDDAVQDTFERAYRSRHRFDPNRPLWPWLVTIAKRACIEVGRRRLNEVVVDIRADQVIAVDDPHREYERRVQAVAISHALSTLTQRHRRLLIGWEVEGRPFDHLAAQEGLSRQALKSVLCRARHGFRAGYTAIAERVGLAAFAFGRLLGRGRERLHRASTLTPGAEFALGSVVVGMTAATLFVALPATRSAAQAERLHAAHAARTVPAPDMGVPPAPSPVASRPPRSASKPVAVPAPAPTPDRRRLPRAAGGAGVDVTPSGARGFLGISWESEDRRVQVTAGLSFDCTEGLWDLACEAGRLTAADP